jgi:hypothetical protein
MADELSSFRAWRPDVKIKSRRLYLKGGSSCGIEIECDGVRSSRSYDGRHSPEKRQHGSVHMPGGNKPDLRAASP